MFFTSAGLLVALLGFALLAPETAIDFFMGIRTLVVTKFGWFYIVSILFFFVLAIWLLVSPHGSLKLGKDDEEPAYSRPAWLAMLFAAGHGAIGLDVGRHQTRRRRHPGESSLSRMTAPPSGTELDLSG